MTALEQLGSALAGTATPSAAARDLVELHLIDTVGAWIAGARTTEGRALLRFRAAMDGPDGDALALDLATRCALARLSEIDDIHLASMTTPGGIVIPAALTLAAATPSATADDVIAAILAGYRGHDPARPRPRRPDNSLSRHLADLFRRAVRGRRGRRAAARARRRVTAHALALALILAAPGVGHHNAATTSRWFAVGQAARNGLTAALAAQQGFTSDLKLAESAFLTGIYGVKPDPTALTDGARRERAPGGGVIQAVVCRAADHGGDAGAAGDHRDRRCARDDGGGQRVRAAASAQDDRSWRRRRRPRFVPHQPALLHGGRGVRAGHWHATVQQTPAQLPAAVRGFMEKIKLQADEEPARRLSPHVGGAGDRRRGHRARPSAPSPMSPAILPARSVARVCATSSRASRGRCSGRRQPNTSSRAAATHSPPVNLPRWSRRSRAPPLRFSGTRGQRASPQSIVTARGGYLCPGAPPCGVPA